MIEFLQSAFSSKLFLVSAIYLLIYIYLKKNVYSYWKKHQVPHEEPTVLLGTVNKEFVMQKSSVGTLCKDSYEKFKSHPFHGIYMFLTPILMVNDPDLIKDILIKDFSHFVDRGVYCNDKVEPLSGNMFHINGDKWKTIRAKCSVFFTTSKLKNIFPILMENANEALDISKENLKHSDILDMKDFTERYFIDVIFSIAFGAKAGTLKNPNNSFRYYGNLAIEKRPVKSALIVFAPSILDFFKISYMNSKSSKFFINLFEDMIEKRRNEKEKRKDFLNLLIDLIENEQIIEKDNEVINEIGAKNVSRKLTVLEASAQAHVFFIAGFETSTSTVCYSLHELASNPDIQDNLYNEIDEVLKSSESLNYDRLMNMKYLDMILKETLRKHPILPTLNRICVKDYQIPNSNYCIPKGMRIIIPVSGIQRDPNYYPDPDKFDPTRFDKENSATRHPGTYLPFGTGPRYCIGKRLGSFQSKLILFVLLANYKFSISEKTLPMSYKIDSFLQKPENDVYLRLEKRNTMQTLSVN